MAAVTRRRVFVKPGSKFAGCRGWGYFTENQHKWDTLAVRLDRVEVLKGSLGSRLEQTSITVVSPNALIDEAASDIICVENLLVRLNCWEVAVLDDLEALAEVQDWPESGEEQPSLLK